MHSVLFGCCSHSMTRLIPASQLSKSIQKKLKEKYLRPTLGSVSFVDRNMKSKEVTEDGLRNLSSDRLE